MREAFRMIVVVMVMFTANVLVDASQTVMHNLSKNFLKAYSACAKELNLPDATDTELIYFWKEGFEVKSREAGCALYCLSTKMDIIDPEGNFHHGNAEELAKKHGSGDEMAKKLVEILHGCEKAEPVSDDKCMRTLGIAMCFKLEIHKLGWAPDPEVLFEELVAEG